MSEFTTASALVGRLRQAFRNHEQNGIVLKPCHVAAILRNLRTIEELARNNEEELAIIEAAGRRYPVRAETRDNVVTFPVSRRRSLHLVGDDGGDVA
jgi:hypothetical protein